MPNDTNDFQPQSLAVLGWSPYFQEHFQKIQTSDQLPARVISVSKNSFLVCSEYGVLTAAVAGKMRYRNEEVYPAVGDWVAVKPLINEKKGIISAVLPRKSRFSRKAAGERTDEQIVAANIDTVFIISGLDGGRNFNLRRIERYLTLAWSSGATPVIILNKVDLCSDAAQFIQNVEGIAPSLHVHAVSARQRLGLAVLRSYLTQGQTVAFLGSSGVGKSSLINALLGAEKQEIGEVRPDDRMGRHTTTRREMILLPAGGIMVDTPGMREIQMWAGEDDLQGAFQDIEMLAAECRFSDCSHNAEPGCAVKAGIARGDLDPTRLASYHKLQNELNYVAAREDQSTRAYEKQKWKPIAKWVKEIQKRP
jgi:ribosome biogenesis GTPase / thiamine phosphate phosphatase